MGHERKPEVNSSLCWIVSATCQGWKTLVLMSGDLPLLMRRRLIPSEEKKSQLPVDVRGSWTSVLKLPILNIELHFVVKFRLVGCRYEVDIRQWYRLWSSAC